MVEGIKIAIDRGGTFTDFYARIPGKEDLVFKLLSVDPANYNDAPTEGIRRVLESAHNVKIPKNEPLDITNVESIKMGTTVATNALLERNGASVVLLTSKNFRDVLEIGNQTRPNIFNISAKKLSQLYSKVIEVDERITLVNYTEGGGPQEPASIEDASGEEYIEASTGDLIRVMTKPKEAAVRAQLEALKAEGYSTLAICFLHSYLYPKHEQFVANIAREMGFQISVSTELQPMIGIVNRCSSTVADAYLLPKIQEYLEGFGSGFKGGLNAMGNKLLFMQSNGGLCPWYKFTGLRAILSGPAGGVVGYAKSCHDSRPDQGKATLGFDMGGTSTDVSRYSGRFEHIYQNVVNEVPIYTPQLDISTVAAGGGSMLFWKNGMFAVGPQSAGAHPGPACYRKGGPLTITDANVFTGRLLPEYFPKIFGPNEDEGLDVHQTRILFEQLASEINSEKSNGYVSPEEVACGFLKVANEAMCRPIRTLTEGKGFNTADHNLSVFGGAGGQHCCSIARTLNVENVIIHKYSSLLSAYGIALADEVIEKQQPISLSWKPENVEKILSKLDELKKLANIEYEKQKTGDARISYETYLNMKYEGTDTCMMVLKPNEGTDFEKVFRQKHQQEFGFSLERDVIAEDARIRLIIHSNSDTSANCFEEFESISKIAAPKPLKHSEVYFESEGWMQSKIYRMESLPKGTTITGPAIILDNTQTILIEPHCEATVLKEHIFVRVTKSKKTILSTSEIDPVQLSVFGHRFMSIAEQMGTTLQMTAISTNIKERLDYSCAIFDSNGKLIANAPHIPGHLGSMFKAVEAQNELWKGKLKKGDVLFANHPSTGGTHLPDITVLTPVLDDSNNVLFWTAARGHHADIGGLTAGSMPSNSKEIWQEGAAIESAKLYSEGVFQEESVIDYLYTKPGQYEGCSGSRALQDNISDLQAHASANYRGITLLEGLIKEFGLNIVLFYMEAIQKSAEVAVRNLLKSAYDRFGGEPMKAVEYLDDGTAIAVTITVNRDDGSAIFDFTETDEQFYGNLNCPIAVLYGSILYVLRCLINVDIPLNSGCMAPLDVRVREGSLFDASFDAATVGSNVETSQRITDVMLKAFKAVAGSQGTCNNFTFGSSDPKFGIFGYYETIAGGGGAGANFQGQSGVQVHTTNTRMTDSESFEKKYPCILHKYEINRGTGGLGLNKGGDGVIREIEFTIPLQATCLMERRVFSPFGMNGGYPGRKGYNYWLRKQADGSFRKVSLGGKNSVWISSGDRVRIETPSGGGWGVPHEEKSENSPIEKNDVSYAPAELVSEPSEVFTGSVALRHLQQISA
ncbi:Piso0_002089 [Millerozyma farinosa CBS 7064]|uniref:Piso0_002089 protein n=1 Tax=Pichia sorbitophila (strain ATCC MYA-4447 / BCRC 22081 / CBS 7064 / NBRC 10061 / NRRL Y-12695) TaxID=559304 RepID=G8YBN5_PICSO|nr:Piso0_002089 [Millerozyma farinosa CBS 7064]